MMLCDKCLSPIHCQCNLLSNSDRLGTDNPESVNNLSQHFLDKSNIYLKKVANLVQFAPSTAQLAQRRLFLRRKINELSPMARIPSEILIEIFQIACKPVRDGYTSSQEVTPLFIGSICRLWRDVAWSTHLLWSTIFLHVSRDHHDTQIQLLGEWLLNAKSAPLSIKLTTENLDEHESALCAFEAIVRILVTKSDQWLTFDYCQPPTGNQNHDIFKNINFPMLTSVSLLSPPSPITPEMFLSAPKLVDITLHQYNFPVVLPWEQVRHFRTGRSSVNGCLKILQQSPNLEKCHFEGVYHHHGDTSETIGVHAYAQLKCFHVRLDYSRCISLFDCITLPSLSDLCIHYEGTKWRPQALSPVKFLFLRSACKLKRLTIRFPYEERDLIPCLEAIPSLVISILK
jgi:F-box-like